MVEVKKFSNFSAPVAIRKKDGSYTTYQCVSDVPEQDGMVKYAAMRGGYLILTVA